MERVKKELNRVISENRNKLEKLHHEMMYGKAESLDVVKQSLSETKLKIQKAQQCIDIIN